MTIRAVVFDVGETLIDETSQWAAEADRLGVTHLTFFGALGAVIERRQDHRETWRMLGVERLDTGLPPFTVDDLYPDALACLRSLHDAGLVIGLAGNQPERAEAVMGSFFASVRLVASSARWGVEKPSPAFFERIVAELGLAPEEIAYVGDRLDNDVLPAKAAGLLAVFIRRGPWGAVHATWPEVADADVRIESLEELLAALAGR